MSKMRFFAPITKVNEETREVEGVLALERKDKQGEIMDYDSSKQYFMEWSDEIHKASGGKSFGNVREMHNRIAAGKLTSIEFDDEKKEIRNVTKVVDDNTWEKVQEGVLNGFSIEGDAMKRWTDKVAKAKRYTVKPYEVSLVDNPAMYGCEFSVVRSGGDVEVRKFHGNSEVKQYWSCGNDCDLEHETKSEASHCGGVIIKFQNTEEGEDIIEKSMYDVSSLSSVISSAQWIDSGSEENKEKMKKAINSLFNVLVDMVKEQKEIFNSSSVTKVNKGEEKMKVKVQKAAQNTEEEQFIDIDTDAIAVDIEKKIAKSMGTAIGEVIKESLAEIVKDMKEDIETLSNAVQKMAGLPKKSKAVSKTMDRKKLADDETEEEEEQPKKKITKTADRNDLLGDMKSALRKPLRLIEIEEEEENDDEN